jgi:hypothetical protein
MSRRTLLRMAAACAALGAGVASAAPLLFDDAAAFIAAAGPLAIEDFESAPWSRDTSYAGTVTSQGLTWSAANTLRASSFAPFSGAVALSDVDGNPDQLDRLTALLPDDTGAFGLHLRSTLWFASVQISLFDAAGGLITQTTQELGDHWSFVGFTTDRAIDQVMLQATRNGGIHVDDFLIDDVRFGALPAAVPEPGSAALLAAALLAAGAARRRPRR